MDEILLWTMKIRDDAVATPKRLHTKVVKVKHKHDRWFFKRQPYTEHIRHVKTQRKLCAPVQNKASLPDIKLS